MDTLRGSVLEQLSLLSSLGFPEPRVVAVDSLDRLASLQRARTEWLANSSKPRDPDLARSRLAAWNDRDPLNQAVLEAVTVPLSQAAAGQASVAFAALERRSNAGGSGAPFEPMEECPARVTSALALLKEQQLGEQWHRRTSGPHALGLHILLPSLAAPIDDAPAQVAADAARGLYLRCCDLVVSFGALPSRDKEAASSVEVLDLEPHLIQKERAAMGTGDAVSSAEAMERCDRLWEEAERLVASLPRKALPRFRALFPDAAPAAPAPAASTEAPGEEAADAAEVIGGPGQ